MSIKAIGSRIRRLRREAGLTQDQVAASLNRVACRSDVAKWETDSNYPRISDIPQLAATLGVTCDYLLTGRESPILQAAIEPLDALTSALRMFTAARAEPTEKITPWAHDPWTSNEIAQLITLAPSMRNKDLAVRFGRTERGVEQKLVELRKAGRVSPSAVTAARSLTDEQREVKALCRAKKLTARETWAIVEKVA